MAYRMDVLECPVRQKDSEIHVEVRRPLKSAMVETCADPASILGVNTLEEGFNWWWATFGVKAKQVIMFARPVDNLHRRDVPCPTARVCQPLCFSQVGLALPQGFFRTFLILDVGRGSIPPGDLATLIAQRHRAIEEPSILAVRESANTHFTFEWFSSSQRY